jgi:3',5'-cyclic AMP phosphodiesterase CpdA
MLRFLHVSDIHLLDLSGVSPWRYVGKRLTGRLNLALSRKKAHDGRIFDEMMAQGVRLGIDRVVVTGDLTNLALEPEFELCRDKLDALPVPVTVIPGNHDAYTAGSVRDARFERYLGHLMQGERPAGAPYPFVQELDDVALIGCSTAIATPPFFATGRLGDEQLRGLAGCLADLRARGKARVVLIHHPPAPGVSKARHALLDLGAFGDVVAEHGAELVLHGHEHVCIETQLPGPDAPVPVHGIASGTSVSQTHRRQASFSIYEASADDLHRDLYSWNGTAFELQSLPS